MKRSIIVASLAILAVGCQKTEISNPVNNPIDFSAETGKQTRTIVNDQSYLTSQPFGVFSYGYKVDASDAEVSGSDSAPMKNVEVTYQTDSWRANPSYGSFYWPNDPLTRLDFYAYSPYIKSKDATLDPTQKDVAHQVMTVTDLTHSRTAGLSFSGYTHSNMYVDFMEATPVKGAVYSDQNGAAADAPTLVPMAFNHKMTQIVFKVTTSEAFPNVSFTVNSIKLIGINNSASYADGTWTPSGAAEYVVFPADSDNGAALKNKAKTDDATLEDVVTLKNTSADASPLASMTTAGVTMIPQNMAKETQGFTIEYKIEGPGVATETVTKTVYFRPDDTEVTNWGNNKYITYNVSIGLKEIKFNPTVVAWDTNQDVSVAI